jgi:homoserine O-acetyltransferase
VQAADKAFDGYIAAGVKQRDANDLLYAIRASEDYDPSPHLERIEARLLAVNSADDFINPPELPMIRDLMSRVRHGRFALIPISEETQGHTTCGIPQIWGPYLKQLLDELQ